MSESTAISMVGESLKNMLEDEMQLTPNVRVTLLAPDENGGGNRRLNLFLYKVQENTHLRNEDWQVRRDDPTRLAPPPLSLNLFYLMTAYAPNDQDTGNTTAHEVLGDGMRVFNEFPIIPAEHLDDGLEDAREQVKIMPGQLDLDEISRVWSTFSEPFRLSVSYEVSVVQIDQSADQQRTMARRVRSVGVPRVQAPWKPPGLNDMAPLQGAVGSTVSFTGENLDGWRAYARMFGRRIVDGLLIEGDRFEITIPGDLPEGFHEIRVDVSRLTRKTFFFEVTP